MVRAAATRSTRVPRVLPEPQEVKTVPTPAAAETPPGADTGEEPGFRPYVPARTVLPEMTVKVFVVGIILSWIMSSANAYLGLYAALTVSAAIPASVISMAVLRFFRQRNILENNLIQTTASAGESVTAGIIFVLPALLFIGYWDSIGIWETMIIAALGGSLGVLFTIPLRRAFIVEARLQYPEGVATVEVLKSGEKGGSGVGYILVAGIMGALYKFMEAGLQLWAGAASWAQQIGRSGIYFGSNLAPALIGVGFIVGLPIAVLIFAGGMISYAVAIPTWLAFHPGFIDVNAGGDAVTAFNLVRRDQIRFIGVGAMATGGVYTLYKLRHALVKGFQSGMAAYRAIKTEGKDTRIRTERDVNMRSVLVMLALFTIPLALLFTYFVTSRFTAIGPGGLYIGVGILMGVLMIFLGFLFSAVAGYMAGVLGSSNNPISGTAIGTILATAGLLALLQIPGDVGAAATILIGGTIASAAAIAGDNMQDLKAGYLLGGTPKNLQIMQIVGAVAAALTIPFVLILLHNAYTIGGNQLPAAQANIMSSIAQGIFGEAQLPWNMFGIGVLAAAAIISLDLFLQWKKAPFRTPVLAVAVGMYLPLETSTPIFAGGLIAFLAARAIRNRTRREAPQATPEALAARVERRLSRGVLFASGLIAGESLMGIVVAGVLASGGKDAAGNIINPIAIFDNVTWYLSGLLVFAYIAYVLYHSVVRRGGQEEPTPSQG